MMLRDSMGRQVLWRRQSFGENHFDTFLAVDGLNLVIVDEAIVSPGDDVLPPEAIIRKMLDDGGYKGVFTIKIRNGGWNWLSINRESRVSGSFSCSLVFKIDGVMVDKGTYNAMSELICNIESYGRLLRPVYPFQKKMKISAVEALEIIGEGKIVTPESLTRAKAKDEDRPRIIPGDSVEVTIRKEKVLGTIKSISSKVSVVRQDGGTGSYPYAAVVRTDNVVYNDELAENIDPSLSSLFEKALDVNRIYKAKLERMDISFPMFPDSDTPKHELVNLKDAPTCVCPVCGWQMAEFQKTALSITGGRGRMICHYCRVRGLIISQTEDTVSLLMLRRPAKNRFAVKEAACCDNCGMFKFSSGRYGKRQTGYCPSANQCVQSFNTCDLWIPRDPDEYEKAMRQHVTNLHYGVKDRRNTSRNDIRDTVYMEEDHKAEIKRAEAAKKAYMHSYGKFWDDLRKVAERWTVSEQSPEKTKEWLEKLDDPC